MSERTVLILGNGGREHALGLALADDPSVGSLHCAPGNPGTAQVATNHPIDATDAAAVTALAQHLGADLVVIGPEAPLVAGVADSLRAAGIDCFGPSAAAARLEGSKQFAKEVMLEAGVPTAASRYCTDAAQVAAALDGFGPPFVVKADGLAAGKGVLVTTDREAALAHARDSLPVVVEEYLDGPEVSLFALTDGTTCLPLLPAQDFKRVGEGDTGPNTGGMGAYTPLPWSPDGLTEAIMSQVVQPTVDTMASRGTPFVGLLYAGLALTSRGLRVVEFNCRFGDPETQGVLALLESPLGEVLHAAATGRLSEIEPLVWRPETAVVVVLAAHGYPGTAATGGVIAGPRLDGGEARLAEPVHIVHAGTGRDDTGALVATGGRVLSVVGRGADLSAARRHAYAAIAELDAPTLFSRGDIARRAEAGDIPTPTL
ncbi:MAG: phosphoribosylamine--glycine ligase [Propioniciclava sp.]